MELLEECWSCWREVGAAEGRLNPLEEVWSSWREVGVAGGRLELLEKGGSEFFNTKKSLPKSLKNF